MSSMHECNISSPHDRGFTLLELVVSLAILAILVSVAIPAYQNFISNQRGKTGANDLMASLIYARSEAIKRNRSVYVRANLDSSSDPDWAAGWIVSTDQDDSYADCTPADPDTTPASCLRVVEKLPNVNVAINDAELGSIEYLRDGRFSAATPTPALIFCTNGALKRVVSLNLVGTPRTDVTEACP